MKGSQLLPGLIVKARRSGFWLAVLNFLMARVIPFNTPHKFRIITVAEDMIRTRAPYSRRNHNHIRGIHACAIATVAEFSAGFLLLTILDPARYRLIMSKLDVDYFYQAKEEIIAEARMSPERLQQEVTLPLQNNDSTSIVMETLVSDRSGNRVALARTTWQIKHWDRVRTNL